MTSQNMASLTIDITVLLKFKRGTLIQHLIVSLAACVGTENIIQDEILNIFTPNRLKKIQLKCFMSKCMLINIEGSHNYDHFHQSICQATII